MDIQEFLKGLLDNGPVVVLAALSLLVALKALDIVGKSQK
jgi:hypothetical protein